MAMLQIVLKGESQTRVEGENRCSAKNFRLEKKEFRKEEEKKLKENLISGM